MKRKYSNCVKWSPSNDNRKKDWIGSCCEGHTSGRNFHCDKHRKIPTKRSKYSSKFKPITGKLG
jgi:hypothetical protein